ncbi:MAG: hypothetical protein HQK54_17905, partial [Oligoflexales bacterium]|nr:hypothetical protein [Oligoflexales bacterium]
AFCKLGCLPCRGDLYDLYVNYADDSDLRRIARDYYNTPGEACSVRDTDRKTILDIIRLKDREFTEASSSILYYFLLRAIDSAQAAKNQRIRNGGLGDVSKELPEDDSLGKDSAEVPCNGERKECTLFKSRVPVYKLIRGEFDEIEKTDLISDRQNHKYQFLCWKVARVPYNIGPRSSSIWVKAKKEGADEEVWIPGVFFAFDITNPESTGLADCTLPLRGSR